MVATLLFMPDDDQRLNAPPSPQTSAAQAAAEEAQKQAKHAQAAALLAQDAASTAQQAATIAQTDADRFKTECDAADERLCRASQAVRDADEKLIQHALK